MKPQYPKMLFKGGVESEDWRIVDNQDDHAAAAKEGYAVIGEAPEEEVKRGPGRPKKEG